jgi:5-methylcytosine-specific restriction endonuclease McrA
MSDILSPWHHVPRKTLTPQQKAKLFHERGGRCHRCRRKLRSGDIWSVEHMFALENGGSNDRDNLDITCSWCKPKKDAADHATAAKSRHVATKHAVPSRERKSKRGFRGGRKFNGEVVWYD